MKRRPVMKLLDTKGMRRYACEELTGHFDEVCDYIDSANQPVVITRDGKDDLIMMSIDLYNSISDDPIRVKEACTATARPKNVSAHYYLKQKFSGRGRNRTLVEDPDGYLFAQGIYHTKILPSDLPEWFVFGRLYHSHGYISAKGVQDMIYLPCYLFPDHLFKDDALLISYQGKIQNKDASKSVSDYSAYDCILSGPIIPEFVEATAAHSEFDVTDIRNEVLKKEGLLCTSVVI
jgi:hypothetical protein